jgi:hypothetical protein
MIHDDALIIPEKTGLRSPDNVWHSDRAADGLVIPATDASTRINGMIQIFLTTLPLSLAASVSITSFLIFFTALLAPENQLRNGLAIIVGGIVANAGLTLVVLLSIGHAASSPHHHNIHAGVNFTLAAICLIVVLLSLKKKKAPRKKKESKMQGGVSAYVVSGMVIRLLSANTVPPYIDAVKDVSGAHLPIMPSTVLCALIMIISMLPLIVIWLIFLFNKEKALAIIHPLGKFLEKNKKNITNITMILIAIYLFILGFDHLGKI